MRRDESGRPGARSADPGSADPGSADAWWKAAVAYQVYPRSFADADGDGVGDLRGVLARLDHLSALGVDVVWLSPVYPSPQDDNGYDVSDYQDVDPTFGSLEDLDALVAALHDRGMRLILDLVVNHTSDEHPWFQQSRSSREDPKRDWYWWRPARPGMAPGSPGAEPTNWRSFFSGPAWELDERTGEYYLHLFSRKQPDLNWENPQVRRAVHDMMRWWLDRGVDGFRMDVLNFISKDPALPDGPAQAGVLGDGSAAFVCGPRIHEFLAEMHREVFAGRPEPLLVVGEMPGVTVEEARRFTDPRRAEIDMVFQFEHVTLDQGASKWDVVPLDLTDLKATFGRWQAGLADVGWNSLYWNNHDQPRIVSRFGDDGAHRVRSAKMLATVLHLHRGTPYVYQGEELGMTNAPFRSVDDVRDVESVNHYRDAVEDQGQPAEAVLAALRAMGRDNARTPMQWDAGPHAGFTSGEPWIPVNPNFVEINAEAALADPDSVFHHYRALIDLRHREPAVVHGDFTMLLPRDRQVYAFTRSHAGTEVLVLGNFSGEDVVARIPEADRWGAAELVVRNYPAPEAAPAAGDRAAQEAGIALRPWETRVYRRRS